MDRVLEELWADHIKIQRLMLRMSKHSTALQFQEDAAEVVDYLGMHFAEEERIMQKYGYHLQGAHQQEHARIQGKAQGLLLKLTAGDPRAVVAMLGHHLAVWDAPLEEWLKKAPSRGL